MIEEEEREPEELVSEREKTHSRAPLVPIKFSFIHLAAQRCIAPVCQAQELNLGLELGDLVSHAVLCPAWTQWHANIVFPLGLVTC